MSAAMKMTYVLGLALAAAAAFGIADRARPKITPSAESVSPQRAELPQNAGASEDATTVSGRVLEHIDVAKYTYLRLATPSGDAWAAVTTADVPLGATVTVTHAVRMDHFTSATLRRTFDVIYFGALSGDGAAAKAATAQDPGIPEALLDAPSGALPPGHPSIPQGTPGADEPIQPPGHPGESPSADLPAVPKLAPAAGPSGHAIADVLANKQKLAGKKIRVHGMVTKVTLDVLGKTFLHVRDGSGDAPGKTDDLAVTTSACPARGDVIVFEGTLRPDADLGIGYRYPALLEDAIVVKE
jgi:hypothetical protein